MMYLNPRTMEKLEGLQPSNLSPAATKPQENIVQDQGYTMSQTSDPVGSENVILSTRNYGMFRFDPLNRVVSPNLVDRLIDSIDAKNLLHLFPIVVNHEFVVIDGQHRLTAAKTLGIPIYYITSKQMVIEDAARVSANTKGWSSDDILNHYCKLGNPDYLVLQAFWRERQWMSILSASKLCTNMRNGEADSNKSLTHLFASGNYKANNIMQAERVCTMAFNFKSWVPFWKESSFISALRNLDSNIDYDHSRMMSRMQSQSSKLVRCSNASDYIKVMNGIYNYRMSDDRKVLLTLIRNNSPKWRS